MSATLKEAETTAAGDPDRYIQLLMGSKDSEDSSGDYYHQTRIISVEAGQQVAVLAEATPPRAIQLGPNLQFAADGRTLVASAEGRLCLEGGRIWIERTLTVPGDVDFATGNIDFPHDVIVRGSILDLFKVTSGGSVLVGKAVEAATVRCQTDLIVRGGIVGKEKGFCNAARDIRARYAANTVLNAGRDILIETQVSNSHLHCGRKLRIGGPLLAGEATATGGIACEFLGCESCLTTIVSAGQDLDFEQSAASEVAEIEHRLQQAQKVQATVEPLMRNQKQLTPVQKEKATELLFEASEVRAQAAKRLESLRRRFEHVQTRSCAEIQVKQLVNPGVIVRFPGLEAIVAKPITGPVQLIPRDHAGQRHIVAVSRHGSAVPLETHTQEEPAIAAVQRLLARSCLRP